jgi:hypothetical protein
VPPWYGVIAIVTVLFLSLLEGSALKIPVVTAVTKLPSAKSFGPKFIPVPVT